MPKTLVFLLLVALWRLKTPEREILLSAPRSSNTKLAIRGLRPSGLRGCNLMAGRSDDRDRRTPAVPAPIAVAWHGAAVKIGPAMPAGIHNLIARMMRRRSTCRPIYLTLLTSATRAAGAHTRHSAWFLPTERQAKEIGHGCGGTALTDRCRGDQRLAGAAPDCWNWFTGAERAAAP